MIMGFSGFGFPKAHGAAFGLLAYQSTWLRVHYGPSSCARCSTSSRWASTPPTRRARGAAARDRAPRRRRQPPARSPARPTARASASASATSRRARRRGRRARRRARGGRPFRSLGDLASRAGAGRPALAQLAWAGACDSLRAGDRARREVLWELGVAAPGDPVPDGTQLALPLDVPDAPALRELEPWGSMIADYATTGLTLGRHPLALLRAELPGGHGHLPRPRDAAPRGAGADRRPRGRPPAPRHRQGHRLPADRGRVRHRQPDRPAARLRAPPPAPCAPSRC